MTRRLDVDEEAATRNPVGPARGMNRTDPARERQRAA
jgi:hypothetical protein